MKTIGMIVGILVLGAWGAMAQMQSRTPIEPFEALDQNGDSLITWNEFHTSYPSADMESFTIIAGGDDQVSPEEWEAFREAHVMGERKFGPEFHEQTRDYGPDYRGPSGEQEYAPGQDQGMEGQMPEGAQQ